MQIVCAKQLSTSFDLLFGFVLCLIEYHATKVHCGSGDVASLIRFPQHYLEFSGQIHAPAALPSFQLDRRLGGPQSPSGRGSEE
jgi:hypothetical protein